jgi:hypothetical protein
MQNFIAIMTPESRFSLKIKVAALVTGEEEACNAPYSSNMMRYR